MSADPTRPPPASPRAGAPGGSSEAGSEAPRSDAAPRDPLDAMRDGSHDAATSDPLGATRDGSLDAATSDSPDAMRDGSFDAAASQRFCATRAGPLDGARSDPLGATRNDPLDADTTPGVAYALAPGVLNLWFWQSLFALIPIAGASVVLALVFDARWPLALAAVAAVAWLALARRYARAYFARFRCLLLRDGLLIRRGVVFRSEVFVPRPRIQHTDVSEGPIARHYGIATLKVFTAGTQLGQLAVEGLPRADAVLLRDRLLGRVGRDAP